MSEHLISSKEMAQFVASGYLRFDDVVPNDLCEGCLEEIREKHFGYLNVGAPFEDTIFKNLTLGPSWRALQDGVPGIFFIHYIFVFVVP